MTLPPLHAAVVHFPIAFVVLAVLADLLGIWTRAPSLRATGLWAITAAGVTAPLALLTGYFDMNRANLSEETDGIVHLHLLTGWFVVSGIVILAVWRGWLSGFGNADWRPIGRLYPVAAVILLGLVTFQGWYGGEMVYSYGASVAASGQGVETHVAAKRRLQKVYEALGAPTGMGHGSMTGQAREQGSGSGETPSAGHSHGAH